MSTTNRTGRKRGNNEGTIRQRPNGLWEAQVSLGAGVRKSYYGKTREEVRAKMTTAQRDLDRGVPVLRDERQTVGQYLTQWLADVQPQLRPSSHRRYTNYVSLHLIPALGSTPLAKLSAAQVQGLVSRALSEGLSPTTVQSLHRVLHRALADALRLGLVVRNVSEQVSAPRRSTAEMQPLSEVQAAAFLAAAAGDRFEGLYVLAITTGMREGELLGLRWRDVNLDHSRLQVRQAVQEAAHGGTVLAEPKTPHSRRTIGLSAHAVSALRAHRARQAQERLTVGPGWTDLDLVFPNHIGTIMAARDLTFRGFRRIRQAAGVGPIRFHDLRHTAATLLLARGVNVKVVSEMLGHADIAITLRVYGHVLPHMQQGAVDVMDRVFGG